MNPFHVSLCQVPQNSPLPSGAVIPAVHGAVSVSQVLWPEQIGLRRSRIVEDTEKHRGQYRAYVERLDDKSLQKRRREEEILEHVIEGRQISTNTWNGSGAETLTDNE
jgi:hypothetical protein